MKIAMLCHSSLGGSGAVASALSKALVERGHIVHVISDHVPYSLRSELIGPLDIVAETATSAFELGVTNLTRLERIIARTGRVVTRPIRRILGLIGSKSQLLFHPVEAIDYPLFSNQLLTLTAASALVHLLAKEKIDVIHAHYAIPFGLSALLARTHYPTVPIVLTVHGTDISVLGQEAAAQPMVVSALRGASMVTAVSSVLADEAAALAGIQVPTVIGNFVDLSLHHPLPNEARLAARKKFASPEEAILVHASNFREVKRPLDLIEILEKVRVVRPARLLLAGDGPLIPDLKRLVREKHLQGHVDFLGPVSDLERILAISDVFLLPSSSESFGLAAAESLSCGTPVVASRVGGIPEMLGETLAGGLHEVGDTTTAASNVLSILERPENDRVALRAAARGHAEQHFSADRPVEQYLAAYRSVQKDPLNLA